MIKDEYCFCYCFDENFNTQAFTSMISLLDKVEEKISIKIIHNTESLFQNIPKTIKLHQNLKDLEIVKFVDTEYEFPNLNNAHVSEATYYRIFLTKYFNKHNYLIYLDADTIILKNPIDYFKRKISELKETNFSIAATTEHNINELSKNDVDNVNNILKRLEMTSNYFNAGVLILNVNKFIDNKLVSTFIEKMNLLNEKIIQWDQDVMNSVFNGQYLDLDNSINFFGYQYKHEHNSKIYILHYVGSKKPWLLSGAFLDSSYFYHKNYSKIFSNNYQIQHKWKLGSIKELLSAIKNKNLFKISHPYIYLFEFLKSLFRFK